MCLPLVPSVEPKHGVDRVASESNGLTPEKDRVQRAAEPGLVRALGGVPGALRPDVRVQAFSRLGGHEGIAAGGALGVHQGV